MTFVAGLSPIRTTYTPLVSGSLADKGIRKYLSDGRIVIIKDGQHYNLHGQKLYQK